jgi:glycerate 2-kinase
VSSGHPSAGAEAGSGSRASPASRPILIAPDAFKGSFTAQQAALALARGVGAARVPAEVLALADGGEGTAEAIHRAKGGTLCSAPVHDPLGRPLDARFLLLPGCAAAVLDSAAASGLPLVAPEERDPLVASTRGTGELIVHAIKAGASHIYVAAGGSATIDGGRGAIEAIEALGGLQGAALTVLCDVQTPFELAGAVFGPQKGASPEQVALLSARLGDFAAALPRDPRGRPMTGCAGGLSGGLWAAFGAELVRGTDFVFGVVGLNAALARARAVVSGEGRLDEQSLDGKLIGELARLCVRSALALHVVTGQSSLDAGRAKNAGIASIREARTEPELFEAGRRIALAAR